MYKWKAPEYVIDILKKNKVQYMDIAYYAWPETFCSTAGPRGGIGGQEMSTFTVEAWVCDDYGPTVFTCAGMYSFDNERFEPFKQIKSWLSAPVTEEATNVWLHSDDKRVP